MRKQSWLARKWDVLALAGVLYAIGGGRERASATAMVWAAPGKTTLFSAVMSLSNVGATETTTTTTRTTCAGGSKDKLRRRRGGGVIMISPSKFLNDKAGGGIGTPTREAGCRPEDHQ